MWRWTAVDSEDGFMSEGPLKRRIQAWAETHPEAADDVVALSVLGTMAVVALLLQWALTAAGFALLGTDNNLLDVLGIVLIILGLSILIGTTIFAPKMLWQVWDRWRP